MLVAFLFWGVCCELSTTAGLVRVHACVRRYLALSAFRRARCPPCILGRARESSRYFHVFLPVDCMSYRDSGIKRHTGTGGKIDIPAALAFPRHHRVSAKNLASPRSSEPIATQLSADAVCCNTKIMQTTSFMQFGHPELSLTRSVSIISTSLSRPASTKQQEDDPQEPWE